MDSRSAKAAALLSIAECLRFGITSVSDLYYYPDATAQAVAESGIKANLALSAYRFIDQNEDFDFETDEQCRELVRVTDKWNGYDGGLTQVDVGSPSQGENTSSAGTDAGAEAAVYLVKKGDTLWGIAKRHGVSLTALIAANPQIKNPNLIYPGDRVTIP